MSPKLIDRAQRKHEIAEVALELFADHGVDGTSISSVARAAGIGKGTVYEYFTSKEELILSAFRVWLEEMSDLWQTAFETTQHPADRLRTYVHAIIHAYLDDDRTVKIMLRMIQMMLHNQEWLRGNPEVRDIFVSLRRHFAEMLQDGVTQGVFRPDIADEIPSLVINLFAYLDGIAFHYLANQEDIDLMQQVDFYLDRLLHYVRQPTTDA